MPFIGGLKLAGLAGRPVLQTFRNRLAQEGRSRLLVRKVVTALGSILGNAIEMGLASRNIVREGVRQDRRQNKLNRTQRKLEVGLDIPTKAEIRTMLECASGRWRPFFVTAVFTGLRASELRGLRWVDVDLEKGQLSVRQRADRYGSIGAPKSEAGSRTIPLAPMVANTLRLSRCPCT